MDRIELVVDATLDSGRVQLIVVEARAGWKQPNRSYARSCARLQPSLRVQQARGERDAAAAALNRVRAALKAAEQAERTVEMTFRLPDQGSLRLFLALCRRYDLRPFRYPRQRYSTVVLRAPEAFIRETLWPEYVEISQALEEYLKDATQRIIREEVFGDAAEAEERAEDPPNSSEVIGLPLKAES